MQSRSVDAGDRTRMLQMLRRFESDDDQGNPYGDSDDEDDVLDMEERLEGLDLSTATSDEILSALTPAERAEFEASLRSGPDALRGYVEIWSPWWERSPDAPATPLVHDMSEEAPKPTKSLVPQPLEGVPPLRKLTSVTPPSDLIFNVVEILYGALPQSAVLALQDTCKLLASRSTILSTLSDVHEIFHVTSSDDPNHHVIPRAMRKRAFASMKKVYFYVALVGDSEAVRTLEELLPVLRLSVEAEVATLIRESGDMQQAHQDAARMTGKGAHGPMVTEFSEN
ncbi:hypothetical protein HKX48_005862 [Thoreauomyces humboldtii]|nr:hypothetical protein HKX48_005862 [Thoreauomyces humboldtii]